MKRRQLNSTARSAVEYLFSRNNDINGYWGIGMLCLLAKSKNIYKMSFKIRPGQIIKIYGCELTDSVTFSQKLVKHNINSTEGRISFFPDGRYENGKDKYTCGLTVAVTHENRTGLYMSYVECWPHDPAVEKRRERYFVIDKAINNGVISKVVKWIIKSWK
jgi:hypothetical protein